MTKLYQLVLDQSVADCGMSYVYQLESGHFVIIDGGYFTDGEAERLYRFLCEHTQEKPYISGWIFSHAHQDHIGVFMDMLLQHSADIEIGQIIYNIQPLELPESSDTWRVMSSDLPCVKKFYELLDEYCSDVKKVIPRMGDEMTIEELKLEFLFSQEYLDEPSSFNDASLVVKITACGQSVLFLGDTWTVGSRVMMQKQADKLKSDIVQIAHHSFNGAPIELYRMIRAETALWPCADYVIPRTWNDPVNVWLRESSGIRRHFISGCGTTELILPYHPPEGESLPFPIRG